MSAGPSLAPVLRVQETLRVDPRQHRRYPITMDVEYKLLKNGRVAQYGFGRTVNISSGGVLFSANDSLPTGGLIELAISWPCLLEGVCALNLKIRGRIVRSDSKEVALQIQQHEFRTAGSPLLEWRSK